MKSFRDRNPYVIGIASVLVIGALVGVAFLVGILHVFERTYTVEGVFADAGGIRPGDSVRVAGVKEGRVSDIRADHVHGNVIVEFKVNRGVHLGPDTRAEIALETLLGTKYMRLSGPVHRPYLQDTPTDERVIPVERTTTPFDVFRLATVGARRVEATDTEKLNTFIRQLADITQGNAADIHTLIDSVAKVSTAISQRDQQLSELFDRFDKLSKLLQDKDETLASLVDQSRAVLALVARRRADVARGVDAADTMASELGRDIHVHTTQLDTIQSTLHPTVDILERRQADVDRTLSWLGPGALGLAQSAQNGPWADIYVRAVGPDLLQVINDELTHPGGSSP